MIIERIFTTSLETKDTSKFYIKDTKAALKKMLEEQYANKCYRKCYILEIMEILEHSPFICEWNRNGGSVRINVTFKVQAVVYDLWEVITAKLIEITEHGELLFKSKYASIMLMNDPLLQNYKIGQVIPLRVYDARYIPHYPDISVRGIPFTPLDEKIEYIVDVEEEPMDNLWKKHKVEIDKFVPRAKKWEKLLDPELKTIKDYKLVELDSIKGYGSIMRPEWMPIQSTKVYWKPMTKSEPLTNGSSTIIKALLNSCIKNVQMANMLADQYDIDEKYAWMNVYKS